MSIPLKYPKSLWSYNPIHKGCLLYVPLWHPNLSSNAFNSIDSFGHAISVTGATHGATGRTFDATDDKIDCENASVLQNVVQKTLIAWIYPTSWGEAAAGNVFAKYSADGWQFQILDSIDGLRFYHFWSGTDGNWTTGASTISLNAWQLVAVSYDNALTTNNAIFYINGALSATTQVGGAPTGVRGDDSGTSLLIGNRAAGDNTFGGIIGECWHYDRILPATEHRAIHTDTKVRYI